jgi:hypothetical protein
VPDLFCSCFQVFPFVIAGRRDPLQFKSKSSGNSKKADFLDEIGLSFVWLPRVDSNQHQGG